MAVGDAHVFPGFFTPVLTQISFQSNRIFFSHASAEVRKIWACIKKGNERKRLWEPNIRSAKKKNLGTHTHKLHNVHIVFRRDEVFHCLKTDVCVLPDLFHTVHLRVLIVNQPFTGQNKRSIEAGPSPFAFHLF